MGNTATPRPNWTPYAPGTPHDQRQQQMLAWQQQYYNANGRLNPGAEGLFEVKGGKVQFKPQGSWLSRNPWPLAAGMMVGGPLIGGAIAGEAATVPIGGTLPGAFGAEMSAIPATAGTTAATAGTAAGTGGGLLGFLKSNAGPLAGAGVGTVNNWMARRAADQQADANRAMLEPFLNYQKYQIAMTDPQAASYLGIQVPQGAIPMRQSVAQGFYKMLPTFAKAGLGTK